MFKKLIVVDAKGHLLGRLASYIAKALLSGTLLSLFRTKSRRSQIRGNQYHWLSLQKQSQICWIFKKKIIN